MEKFSIPVSDGNKVVGSETFVVGTEDNYNFYIGEEPVLVIDTTTNALILDDPDNEYGAMLPEATLTQKGAKQLKIKNLTVDSNNSITFVMEGDSATYRIDGNSLSKKVDGKFIPVKTWEKPFNVELPQNLPKQIKKGQVKWEEFPNQMTEMLAKDYKYKVLEFPDKNLKLMKSPEGELFYSVGQHMRPCGDLKYYKNAETSSLGILDATKSGANGKATSGHAYDLSPEELAKVGKFVGDKEPKYTDPNKEKSPIDYTKPRALSDATKDFVATKTDDEKKEDEKKEDEKKEDEKKEEEKKDDKKDGDGNPADPKPADPKPAENTKPAGPPPPSPADKAKEKEAAKARRQGMIKGIQAVSIIAFSAMFMAAFTGAAIGLGPAIFMMALFMFAATFMTDFIDNFIAHIGGLLNLVDDFKKSIELSRNLQHLTTKEMKKLNKYEKQLAQGKKPKKFLFFDATNDYKRLSMRQQYNISENQYAKLKEKPEFYAFNPVESRAMEQRDEFYEKQNAELAKIDKALKKCDEVLKSPDDYKLDDLEKTQLKEYRDKLDSYKAGIQGLKNDVAEKHNSEVVQRARDAVMDDKIISPDVSELDRTSYEDLKKQKGLTDEKPSLSHTNIEAKINGVKKEMGTDLAMNQNR